MKRNLTKFEKKKNQRRNRTNGGRQWLRSMQTFAPPTLLPNAWMPGLGFMGFNPTH